jgi:hypothetical protein
MRLSSVGFFIIALAVAAIAGGAIWAAIEAAYENVHLARAEDQLLSLIAVAQTTAAKDPQFAQIADEDLISTLWRLGKIITTNGPAPTLNNIWNGSIRMSVASPLVARVETDVPVRDCRQLARFFGNEATGLGLQTMQARENAGSWRQFYSASSGIKTLGDEAVNAACGNAGSATLALVLRLR